MIVSFIFWGNIGLTILYYAIPLYFAETGVFYCYCCVLTRTDCKTRLLPEFVIFVKVRSVSLSVCLSACLSVWVSVCTWVSVCNRHSGSGIEFKDASQLSGMKGRQLDADSDREGPRGWRGWGGGLWLTAPGQSLK